MKNRSKSISVPKKRMSRLIVTTSARKSLYDEDVKLTMQRQAKEADIPFFNDDDDAEQSSSSDSNSDENGNNEKLEERKEPNENDP